MPNLKDTLKQLQKDYKELERVTNEGQVMIDLAKESKIDVTEAEATLKSNIIQLKYMKDALNNTMRRHFPEENVE